MYIVNTVHPHSRDNTPTKNNNMKIALYLIGSALLASSVCSAEEGKKRKRPMPDRGAMAEKIFKKLDADSSGTVSLEEFKAGPRAKENPEKAEEIFKKIDADSSGGITFEEFKSAKPPRKDGKGGKEGKPATE